MEILSVKLKKFRKNKDVTQKVVAQDIRITERQYIDVENGKAKPTIDTLIKLADYYDVSLDYLIGRSDVKDRQ